METDFNSMLPVKHLAPKILMAVNYYGHLLARRLGWVAPVCHKREGVTLYHCMHSLQYDGRPGGCLVVRVGTWNLGSLSGKGGEHLKNMRKDD